MLLFLLHALGYGAAVVLAPHARAGAPDSNVYVVAFAVSITVQIVTASALTLLAPCTALRSWCPLAQSLTVSLVAATFASCALLLTLGVSTVSLLDLRCAGSVRASRKLR